jgi:hypothetical protein
MCLLHTHPADTSFDKDDITDFYTYNSDGLGVMWSENDILYTHKFLPPNAEAAWKFYQEHIQGRDCVVHWRMKTHGLIDLENCHPYPIFGAGSTMPLSLMHNGVLSTGNDKDKSKSDTWHYVKDYLVPLLQDHPDMFNNPVLKALLEEHIGSGNRFIMLNHRGETSIINEEDFVEYKGAKLSNTYAWSSEKGGYGYSHSNRSSWYDYDGYGNNYSSNYATGSLTTSASVTGSNRLFAPTKEDKIRALATEFFQTLREMGFNKAYYALTFTQASDAIDDSGPEIWKDFMTFITCAKEGTLDDDEIIACIDDPDSFMIDLLYDGFEEEDGAVIAVDEIEDEDGKTDNDIHREQQLEARLREEARIREEMIAYQENMIPTRNLLHHIAEMGVQ